MIASRAPRRDRHRMANGRTGLMEVNNRHYVSAPSVSTTATRTVCNGNGRWCLVSVVSTGRRRRAETTVRPL